MAELDGLGDSYDREIKEIEPDLDPQIPEIGQELAGKNSLEPELEPDAGLANDAGAMSIDVASNVAVGGKSARGEQPDVPYDKKNSFIDELCLENCITREEFDATQPIPRAEWIAGVSETAQRIERIKILNYNERKKKIRRLNKKKSRLKAEKIVVEEEKSDLLLLDRWRDLIPDLETNSDHINTDLLISKRQSKSVDPWSRGVIIVDNFRHSLRHLKLQLLGHFDTKELDVVGKTKITRLPKGGKKIVFNPTSLSLLLKDFKPVNEDGTIGHVHPPRSTLSQNDCEVILKGVPREYTDKDLIIGLIPPVVAVDRFM